MLERIISTVDDLEENVKKKYFEVALKLSSTIIETMRNLTKAELTSERSLTLRKSAEDFRTKLNTALIMAPQALDPALVFRQVQQLKSNARSLLDTHLGALRTDYQDNESTVIKISGMKQLADDLSLSRDSPRSASAQAARKLSTNENLSSEEKASLELFTAKFSTISALETNRETLENMDVLLKANLQTFSDIKNRQLSSKDLRRWAADKEAPEHKAAAKLLQIITETCKFPKNMEEQIIALETAQQKMLQNLEKTPTKMTDSLLEYNEINFAVEKLRAFINDIRQISEKLMKQIMTKSFMNSPNATTANVGKEVKERDAKITLCLQKGFEQIAVLEAYVQKNNPSAAVNKPAKKNFSEKVADFFQKRQVRVHPSVPAENKPVTNNYVDDNNPPKNKMR